jgi:hypothetical protein
MLGSSVPIGPMPTMNPLDTVRKAGGETLHASSTQVTTRTLRINRSIVSAKVRLNSQDGAGLAAQGTRRFSMAALVAIRAAGK